MLTDLLELSSPGWSRLRTDPCAMWALLAATQLQPITETSIPPRGVPGLPTMTLGLSWAALIVICGLSPWLTCLISEDKDPSQPLDLRLHTCSFHKWHGKNLLNSCGLGLQDSSALGWAYTMREAARTAHEA